MRRSPDTGLSESLESGWVFAPKDASGDSKRSAERSALGEKGKAMRERFKPAGKAAQTTLTGFVRKPSPLDSGMSKDMPPPPPRPPKAAKPPAAQAPPEEEAPKSAPKSDVQTCHPCHPENVARAGDSSTSCSGVSQRCSPATSGMTFSSQFYRRSLSASLMPRGALWTNSRGTIGGQIFSLAGIIKAYFPGVQLGDVFEMETGCLRGDADHAYVDKDPGYADEFIIMWRDPMNGGS